MLFGDVVHFAFENRIERAHGVRDGAVGAVHSRELRSDVERLRKEFLNFSRAGNRELVFVGKLVHAENRNDVLQIFVFLQNGLDGAGNAEMIFADDLRRECLRCRSKRIDRRINRELGDFSIEHDCRVQVRKRVRGSGVGKVIRGNVNGLERRDGTFFRRSDSFLQIAHFRCKRRLITDGGGRAPEQRGNFRSRLRKTENVVDEEQNVLPFFIAEIFRHRERGQRHAHTRSRRFVHLPVHERDFGF